jgi:LytR cell envelope-related transcriptional attenuator
MDVVQEIGVYVGAASFVGLAIFLPLFLSQARDIRRLRAWSEREPEAAEQAVEAAIATARVAQQAAVARATGAAEEARAEVRAAARDAAAMSQSPAARVAADRPATTRITAERAALRQPGWRRWLSRGPGTRQLMWIVGSVFALGLAVALISLQLAGGGDEVADGPEPTVEEAGVVKADVDVAVLNGTAVPGLAAKVGDDVDTSGYALGVVTNSDVPADESMVLFERGHEDEARAVARDLGIDAVDLIEPESSALAEGADVVVIAGEDRTQL